MQRSCQAPPTTIYGLLGDDVLYLQIVSLKEKFDSNSSQVTFHDNTEHWFIRDGADPKPLVGDVSTLTVKCESVGHGPVQAAWPTLEKNVAYQRRMTATLADSEWRKPGPGSPSHDPQVSAVFKVALSDLGGYSAHEQPNRNQGAAEEMLYLVLTITGTLDGITWYAPAEVNPVLFDDSPAPGKLVDFTKAELSDIPATHSYYDETNKP